MKRTQNQYSDLVPQIIEEINERFESDGSSDKSEIIKETCIKHGVRPKNIMAIIYGLFKV